MPHIADHFFIAGLPEDYHFTDHKSETRSRDAATRRAKTLRTKGRVQAVRKVVDNRPDTAEQKQVLFQILTRLDDTFELRPLDLPISSARIEDDDSCSSLDETTLRQASDSEGSSDTAPSPPMTASGYAHVIPDRKSTMQAEGLHPLSKKYPPKLLSRYPDLFDCNRLSFPDYLPMFVFPDDMNIKLSEERPNAVWHSFSLTQASGEHIHGTCIILWVQVTHAQAEQLEAACEAWQQAHLSQEDKELASSLSSRLAEQRARLSQLLLRLAQATSIERERLADTIEECEEKIAMYASMLKPLRMDGMSQGAVYWAPRAYGVLGQEAAFQRTWRDWLLATCASYFPNELQHVPLPTHTEAPLLPLERYIVQFLSETPFPPLGQSRISLPMRTTTLSIIREPANEVPGSRRIDLYPLFRALSIINIVKLCEAALLESRIVLISAHTSMLSLAAQGLLSLLWPFEWQGVFIPVLPRRLVQGLEAPTPYIMGINAAWTNIEYPIGSDVVLCHLDNNTIDGTVPELPSGIRRKFTSLLSQASMMHSVYQLPYGPPTYCIDAYPHNSVVFGPGACKTDGPSELNALLLNRGYASEDTIQGAPPALNVFAKHEIRPLQVVQRTSTATRSVSTMMGSLDSNRRRMHHSNFPSMSRRRGSVISIDDLLLYDSGGSSETSPESSITSRGLHTMYSMQPPASAYAASTLFSTMPSIKEDYQQPLHTSNALNLIVHREGHQMRQSTATNKAKGQRCAFSLEPIDGPFYTCLHCGLLVAAKHVHDISLPCLPAAFDSAEVRAAFLRSFATLMRDYRLSTRPTVFGIRTQRDREQIFHFDKEAFLTHTAAQLGCARHAESFLDRFSQTSLFSGFIDARCKVAIGHGSIALFDDIILAKVKRSKAGLFGIRSEPTVLRDMSCLYRQITSAPGANTQHLPEGWQSDITTPPAVLRTTHLLYPWNNAF
ncbi:AEX-3 domain-domain-containing protein [Protomyces lactucae-debilis]|uniref:AEX-3 domain-domain-containing protein n=1 Tax=Protomyces lactucae-debilis TaxID=2754530 RepID=A0A1Y2FI45_PROLT|nr:AEX-3 domain-containing protein [Protomyces lactucae-debilis]ORY83054.1 AEX-3 domain-domain-containing protein [Protomyces lactucae-debilis]